MSLLPLEEEHDLGYKSISWATRTTFLSIKSLVEGWSVAVHDGFGGVVNCTAAYPHTL